MNLADLPKQYDPRDAQDRWYAFWLERGYFHADPQSGKPPFCMVIPPPNVTGALHLGHALNNTLQDILVRWKRMSGFESLWLPGTDHAGIATQAVVEKRLFEEEKRTRHDLGREKLVEKIWDWKEEYQQRILNQLRLMGCSCDWDRTRFTLDSVCISAVRRTFFGMFRDGLIFRGKRLVNWDTHLRTAVSDDEIYYEDVQGQLWTIAYPLTSDPTVFLHVSTTRPETMLGDTAVAVHPDDPRYRAYIGQTVTLPLTGRTIPIVADGLLVDPEFGTGCVKVTPAHDPNDYQTGLRHHLPMINLLNPDGTYNENAGAYAGLTIKKVREKVTADLEAQGALVKTEPYQTRLNYSDRSKTAIEPYLSDQWFVKMDRLAQQAIDAVKDGRIQFHPDRYARSYLDWLGEKRDWCISRQLWWGHRIPIWRCDGESVTEDHLKAAFGGREDVCWHRAESGDWLISALDDLPAQSLVGVAGAEVNLVQDPDVLDTWFSSALWPHSTLGWPEETAELKKFYPTTVLSTARDIITLWVARMVITGLYNLNDIPFYHVYIHPVILDGKGERMSKSKGNGVDPVDIIELYGADVLRYTLAQVATETQDVRFPVTKVKLPDGREVNNSEKFETSRTFPNKIWNAARLVLMNLENYTPALVPQETWPLEDRWILSLLRKTAAIATAELEVFHFAEVARLLRDFTWGEFCDWYLELVKARLRDPATRPAAQRTLAVVLDGICRLIHPIMPFVTEQIWQFLREAAPVRGLESLVESEESACIAAWPRYPDAWDDPLAEATVAQWQEKIRTIRNLRAERNIPETAKIQPVIVACDEIAAILEQGRAILTELTKSEHITIVPSLASRPSEAAVTVLADAEILIPLSGLIDHEAEKTRRKKALADIDKQLHGVRAKIHNESFLARAPAEVIAQQRAREAELLAQRDTLEALLAQ